MQVDDGLPCGVPVAEDDLEEAVREAGVRDDLGGRQRRERGLDVGPQDDGVACEQGRERVADGEDEGVVPGRDDADDALGPVVLDGPREQGKHADVLDVAQQDRPATGVVPGDHRDVTDLLEGVGTGLARLELDEVEQLGLPVEDEVVDPQEHRGALRHGGHGPRPLGDPGGRHRLGHVAGGGQR